MKIAMLGLKGLPAVHGGVERHVEELGARLAQRGHEVTAFCRKAYTEQPGEHRGIRLLLSPTIHTKHLDATVHTLLGGFKAAFSEFDLIHYHAIGPASMCFIPRVFGKPVIATVHALDFKREKWSPFAKWALRRAEGATLFFAGRVIVVSKDLAERYSGKKTPVTYIPNGVPKPEKLEAKEITEKWGLTKGEYLFWAGRFVPEKEIQTLIDAFTMCKTDMKLVLAGGVSHADRYIEQIKEKAEADPRIILPGFVSGDLLAELFSNAAGYVLPSTLEGLPVALLEAMSYGLPCIASDIGPNLEVGRATAGEVVRFFKMRDTEGLAEELQALMDHPEEFEKMGLAGAEHVTAEYDWAAIAEKTEKEYEALLAGRR